MKEILIKFLIELNDKGLINNHDFDYKEVAQNFVNKNKTKMKKSELIKRLEAAHGCLIGSRISNTTAENQFNDIIEDLKHDKQITNCPKCDSDNIQQYIYIGCNDCGGEFSTSCE